MKTAILAAATLLAGLAGAAPASAQHTVVHQRTVVTHHREYGRHHTRKVCHNERHGRHVTRVCRTVRY